MPRGVAIIVGLVGVRELQVTIAFHRESLEICILQKFQLALRRKLRLGGGANHEGD